MRTTSPARLGGGAPDWKVAVALLAVYVGGGSNYLAIRVSVAEVPPALLMAVRFAAAGLVTVAFLLVTGRARELRLSGAQLARALSAGVVLLAIGNVVMATGLRSVPAGLASLLAATVPLWVTAFAWASRSSSVHPVTLVGVSVGFVGVLVTSWSSLGEGSVSPRGVAWVLAAALCWAVGLTITGSPRGGGHPLAIAVYQMVAASVVLTPVAVALGEPGELSGTHVGPTTALALVYLVVVGSVLTHCATIWVTIRVSLAVGSTGAYVNPVVAVALGAIVLGEPLRPVVVLGGLLILAGVVLVGRGHSARVLVESATQPVAAAAPAGPTAS